MILYSFFAIETYDDPDQYDEPFGTVILNHVPNVGDVIPLNWLGGAKAYDAVVVRVSERDLELGVKRVKE